MSSIAHLFVAGGFGGVSAGDFYWFTLMIALNVSFYIVSFTKDLRRFNGSEEPIWIICR